MWDAFVARLRTMWNGQNRQARMLAAGGIGVVSVAILAVGALYLFDKPNYEVLFSNLAPSDASAVTQRLKEDKVPYQLSPGGRTVYVPSQDLSQERVAIAGANIIKGGGVGYELFDRTNFGMTAFQERIDKTRAIEGELERTIDGLDPVAAARVNIASPQPSLYSTTQQAATASVAITTKPGMGLSSRQVEGITMLVARAVTGLKPEAVTIINQDGQVLLPAPSEIAGKAAQDPLNLTQEQLVAKQRYEASLQASIQSMLDQTIGRGHAVARVSTKMDFDANSTETKNYAPMGTVLSQQNKRESYSGTQPIRGAVGVPGTTSNIGTYQALQGPSGAGKYNKSENTTNYDISVQSTKHIDAPGKVLQTSVAVLVNSSGGANSYSLTPANIAQVRNAVIAAAGLNLANGDQVSVEAIPFNPAVSAPRSSAPSAATAFGIPTWAAAAVGVVALLALLGLLAGRLRSHRFSPSMGPPSFDSSLAEELPPFEDHPMLDGIPGIAAPIRSAADLTREQMIEYVTTVAQESPDSVAKLVKLWLAQ